MTDVSRLDAEALLVRGLTQSRLGRHEAALMSLNAALQRQPQEAAIAFALSREYAATDDFATAEFYARRAVATSENGHFRVGLAQILAAAGNEPEAAAVLQKRAGTDPIVDLELSRSGSYGSRSSVPPGSTQHEAESTPATDSSTTSHDDFAQVNALDALQRQLISDPHDTSVLRTLAGDYMRLGQPSDARPLFEQLVDADVRSADGWIGFAAATLYCGEADKAMDLINEALLLFPGSTDLHVLAIRTNLVLGLSGQAGDIAAQSLELADEKAGNDASRLKSYATLAMRARGIDVERVLASDSVAHSLDVLGVALLAHAHAQAGRTDLAVDLLSRIDVPAWNEWEVAEEAGRAWHLTGNTDRAAAFLKIAAGSPYAHRDLLELAAQVLEDSGDTQAARSLRERVERAVE